jgi:hypothetical protein
MDLLNISFPGAQLAQANHLAKDLRTLFAAEGFPANTLVVRKETAATMDLGSIFAVTSAALQVLSIGFDSYSIARSIHELVKRERCALRVKTQKGVVEFGPGEIDAVALRDALNDLIDVGTQPQP